SGAIPRPRCNGPMIGYKPWSRRRRMGRIPRPLHSHDGTEGRLMKHFLRTQLSPDAVLDGADAFFPTIGLRATAQAARTREFSGPLGTLALSVKKEGGHYTFVEI